MTPINTLLLLLLLHIAVLRIEAAVSVTSNSSQWALLQQSIGVSAMHMQLLSNDRVVIFDRTDFGPSNLSLPAGRCRSDPADRALQLDCTAHSAEYDVVANAFRPLTILTDTWCSSGSLTQDGSLQQTGGWNDGERAARTFRPCDDGACDWSEVPQALAVRRWYATNHVLPDGRAVIVGGRRQFSYEFYPKSNPSDTTVFALPFLRETRDTEENNLYPFVHLNIDGNLFIFANNRAILLDYTKNAVVRTYPPMPGGHPRSYPSSGSSVLLPLKPSPKEAEVLICGGAPKGSYLQALQGSSFTGALDTCGRIKITDNAPTWTMETMPIPRVMGDTVLLPNGQLLIINGAASGTAGWELGHEPVLAPLVYDPNAPLNSRFTEQSQSSIPRMYHSSAILLRDGRVLVGGSNPHVCYNFSGVDYPTELSLEAFSPHYLDPESSSSRPRILTSPAPVQLTYGVSFNLRFTVERTSAVNAISVTMIAPSFATHSFSMNQRMLVLEIRNMTTAKAASEAGTYEVVAVAVAPASGVLAPSGYYMLFVVNGEVPSEGIWARIQ